MNLCIFMYKYTQILITKLFSCNLQKDIIQSWKFGKDSSKRNILALQIIKKTDQVMLRIGTAHDQHLFFILHIKHMLQCADIPEIFFFQGNGLIFVYLISN